MGNTLKDLRPGEAATISGFKDNEISLKLMELGVLPGATITMLRKAPLGDPIAFAFAGSIISMRKMEAETVLMEPKQDVG